MCLKDWSGLWSFWSGFCLDCACAHWHRRRNGISWPGLVPKVEEREMLALADSHTPCKLGSHGWKKREKIKKTSWSAVKQKMQPIVFLLYIWERAFCDPFLSNCPASWQASPGDGNITINLTGVEKWLKWADKWAAKTAMTVLQKTWAVHNLRAAAAKHLKLQFRATDGGFFKRKRPIYRSVGWQNWSRAMLEHGLNRNAN